MSLGIEQVNNHTVTPLRLEIEGSGLPVKGKELINELYSNIFLVARKKSGKTMAIAKIIKEVCLSKFTTVIVFCTTINKDPAWLAIKRMCEKMKIPFVGYTDLRENGINYLDVFLKSLEEEAEKSDGEAEESDSAQAITLFSEEKEEEEKEEKRVRRMKYQAPKYLVVFDDLSHELKNPSLASFLKKNRHYQTKVVISSQYPYDMRPESRKQIDTWLIFKGQPVKKLEILYKDMDCNLPFALFWKMYRIATAKPFSFFYCDTNHDDYRQNFTHKFKIKI